MSISGLITKLKDSLGTHPLCIERKGSGIARIIELSPFPRNLKPHAYCVYTVVK